MEISPARAYCRIRISAMGKKKGSPLAANIEIEFDGQGFKVFVFPNASSGHRVYCRCWAET